MSVEYMIDLEKRLLVLKGTGVVTGPDMHAYVGRVLEDPDVRSVTKELVDFRQAEFNMGPEDVRGFASADRTRFDGLQIERRAILVSNELQFGLMRMYGQYMASMQQDVRSFYDMDEALRWLELGSDSEGT